MFIYVRTYTAYHSDFVELQCKCEKCGHDFTFKFINTSIGIGISPYGMTDSHAKESAITGAQTAFKSAPSSKVPHFPCTNCGWYQSWMNSNFRKKRLLIPLIALCSAMPIIYLASLVDFLMKFERPGLSEALRIIFTSPLNLLLTIPSTIALVSIIAIKLNSDLNKNAPPVTAWDASMDTAQEMSYYISSDQGDSQKGPFLRSEIQSMLNCNRITTDVLISESEEIQWKPIRDVLPKLLQVSNSPV
jgi:hypothetical protein